MSININWREKDGMEVKGERLRERERGVEGNTGKTEMEKSKGAKEGKRKARGRREKEETPGFSNTHELLIIDLE